jgi:hypothetical protein
MMNEPFYQQFLEHHLGGSHCKLKCGETDVTTPTIHAEIKKGSAWKGAFGQLLCYNHESPRNDLRLYLFGKVTADSEYIAELLGKYNIRLFTLNYANDLMTITNVSENSIETVPWEEPEELEIELTDEIKEDIRNTICKSYLENTEIDLDKVAKWFGTPKYKIMETLRNSSSYNEGIDFKSTKAPNPNKKDPRSNNYKQVLLTFKCFKHLMMVSRARNTNLMRDFIIDLEKELIGQNFENKNSHSPPPNVSMDPSYK